MLQVHGLYCHDFTSGVEEVAFSWSIVADDQWHHVACAKNSTSGTLVAIVDGIPGQVQIRRQ